jgi:cyclopropane-fatty-acyl-phospholipid synthase
MTAPDDHYPTPVGPAHLGIGPIAAPALPRFADPRRRLLARLVAPLAVGTLRVVLPSGAVVVQSGPVAGPEATIHLHRWRALARIGLGGDIGFGEAYVAGEWSSPDPVALLRLAARNLDALAATIRGAPLARALARLRHLARPNSKRGSKRNIIAHYDLGNAFYRHWLDDTMLYSAALWSDAATTLEAAQTAKLARIRALLALDGGDSVLEIGCGWGALAADLAATAGAHVTGLTLSPSQLAWGRDVAARAGVAERVDLRLQDYRDVGGTYDRIVSIEMFEAVGEAWWPTYFETVARCLKPGGRAVLQVITIADERLDAYRRDTDFIQHHVFPGGFLPSPTAFRAAAGRAGLAVADEETFGASYAATLAEWRRRFHAAWDAIARQGFDDRFRRLWDYYLAYCEAGFREATIDVGFYTLVHAGDGAGR